MTGSHEAVAELDRARVEDGELSVYLICSRGDCNEGVCIFYAPPIEWEEHGIYYNLIDEEKWTHDEKGRWLCQKCGEKVAIKGGSDG